MHERIKSIEFLRFFSILAVVLIHTTTRTLEASQFDITGYAWTLFLNQIARFAVPLFFMISGCVLEISYKEEMGYWAFIKKRFSKIFIPYIFWSLIYYYFVYNQNHDNLIKVFLTGNASYQLYFIPTLCIFYLLFPVLHKIYKFISNKYFLFLIIASQLILQYYDYYIKNFDFEDPIHIALMAYSFFVIGIVMARNREKLGQFVRRWKYVFILLTTLTGSFIYWEGQTRYLTTGNYLSYYSQWRPSVFFYTVLVCLVLSRLFNKTKFQNLTIEKFSKLSFLVFFVHVIILEIVWRLVGKSVFYLFSSNAFGRIAFDPIFFLLVFALSYSIAFLLHKIPKVARVVG